MLELGRIQSEMAEALAEAGTSVQVSWREWPAGTATDPVTRSKLGTPETKTMVVKGMIHFPEPRANSSVQQFNEIELGDCIVDFREDVALTGKEDVSLMFLDSAGNPIDGQKWVPKPVRERLAQTWGVIVQGVKLLRPVLLRKAT